MKHKSHFSILATFCSYYFKKRQCHSLWQECCQLLYYLYEFSSVPYSTYSMLDHDSTKAPIEGSGAKGAHRASSGPTDNGRPSKAVICPTPKSRKRARSKTNRQTKVSQDRRTWAEVVKTPPRQ
jgi:hypothetical protein